MKIRKLITLVLSLFLLATVSVFAVSCAKEESKKPESESAQESVGNEDVESAVVEKTTAIVKFNVNTDLKTNVLKDREVAIGRRVSQPKLFIIDENPDNLQVYGWYTSANCDENTRWDFKKGKVAGDMTLYAKWVELYDVHYYVNGEYHSTVEIFNGDCIEETADFLAGYKYLGSFTDATHTEKFDFTKPITGETNVYVGRSQGIYLSDSVEDGLLSSGNLTDWLTALCGSYNPEKGTEEGWVEEYTIKSTGEKCTYVNFGLNPEWGDGYVELSLNLDITQSQIIRLAFKNIGSGSKINCYFTAMIDENTYSETGQSYNNNFNYPNYTGSAVGDAMPIPSKMSEDDDWVTVDFNLYEVYKNGYSIWGTSKLLGALRIEVNHKNVNADDWSNEMLIKSIEGIPYEIVVEDSADVTEKMVNATEEELKVVADAMAENKNGISLIKDYDQLSKTSGNVEVFKTTEGMLFYAENEVVARENNGERKSFTVTVPEGRKVDIGELTTLHVTLQNYGYAEELLIYVYNDEGVPIKTTLEISARMLEPRTYSVNMYGLFGMKGEFRKIEFVYTSIGVDNLLLFKDVTFGEFVPYDTVGLNFNDKFTFGISSTEDVAVSFDPNLKGTAFNVSKTGATVVSADKPYDATNEGYSYMTLKYNLPEDSSITGVTAELKVNGEFKTPYVYDLTGVKKGAGEIKLPLILEERGNVKAVKLTFNGTGKIIINELAYSVNESSLPFYGSYEVVYQGHHDWKGTYNYYEYDAKGFSSTFIKGPNETSLGFSIYIGFSANEPYLNAPHKTKNVLITGKTKVTLVYQNRTETADLGMHLSFERNDFGSGDANGIPVKQTSGIAIKSNMQEYEWASITVELTEEEVATYLGLYLAKVNIDFPGSEITIRAISIEVEPSTEVEG